MIKIKKRMIFRILHIFLFFILFCFLFLFLIIFVFSIFIYTPPKIYKEDWGIDIPYPKKIEYITNGEGYINFLIMKFKPEDVQALTKERHMNKINEENIEILNINYKKLIEEFYTKFFTEEEKNIFYSKNLKDLFNKKNYYVLIEQNTPYSSDYKFLFLILDTEQNIMYSFDYKAYTR